MYKVIALLVSEEETKGYIMRNMDDYSIHKWSRELLVDKVEAGEVMDVTVGVEPTSNKCHKLYGCNGFKFKYAEQVDCNNYEAWKTQQLVKDQCMMKWLDSNIGMIRNAVASDIATNIGELKNLVSDLQNGMAEVKNKVDTDIGDLESSIESLRDEIDKIQYEVDRLDSRSRYYKLKY